MKRIMTVLGMFLATAAFNNINAQTVIDPVPENTQISESGDVGFGIRGSIDGVGINVRPYITDHLVFEGQANVGGLSAMQGTSVYGVGLLEGAFHFNNPAWTVYLGLGGHVGTWDPGMERSPDSDNGTVIVDNDKSETIYGVDAMAGVEYAIPQSPFAVNLDFKPAVNFNEGEPTWFKHNMVGLGARVYIR